MRLQVYLSHSGICSRRAAKELLLSGNVTVNGVKVYEPSFKVDPERDKILLKNKEIALKEHIYILFNKPKGVTTTKKDPFAKETVLDYLPEKFKYLNPCGRLDKDTTGLLILTNDGDFLNRVTHPKFNINKIYIAVINRPFAYSDKKILERGVRLDDGYTAPCEISIKNRFTIEIMIHEGRKRQVRRMFSKLGYRVLELKRIKEGAIALGAVKEGSWRFLKKEEIGNFFNHP